MDQFLIVSTKMPHTLAHCSSEHAANAEIFISRHLYRYLQRWRLYTVTVMKQHAATDNTGSAWWDSLLEFHNTWRKPWPQQNQSTISEPTSWQHVSKSGKRMKQITNLAYKVRFVSSVTGKGKINSDIKNFQAH